MWMTPDRDTSAVEGTTFPLLVGRYPIVYLWVPRCQCQIYAWCPVHGYWRGYDEHGPFRNTTAFTGKERKGGETWNRKNLRAY